MMRSLKDAQQSVLGRTPLRYQFEVIPHAVEGIPDGVEAVSLVWEKGSKLCFTDPAPVDPATRTATFKEVMRQSLSPNPRLQFQIHLSHRYATTPL
ncbi:hypothetical protein MNEG_11258 [Monoraphidium neglectum]|uniref:Uncharacterized protein n=1 Tax=Monoraphidium neglectum TaxID=145388 RepID=A0A0D2JAD3_9CHLO|nr:hypothetical protein MNEG_11258 [Monoraphidium neglectum]KIY96702.1 hypothetical protein MNEG_11258 [Monoraphidium neglectum]|eukprot:XP_013895722.1 hypothetical protein MNEG_11258 [Monoraphidium neglectum]